MPIPPCMWLKDDGGADIKGSIDVEDREGSIVQKSPGASWMATFSIPMPGTIALRHNETCMPHAVREGQSAGFVSGYQHQNSAAQNLLNHLV